MPRSTLTGSRIRERRTLEGLKQADLARSVGISPAYLNLIEHNRRRIGGKLLVDLARELGVEVAQLSEGAQAPLIDGLREAASGAGPQTDAPEVERAEEFAGRFPGWAALTVAQRDRIEALERRVEALSDRLAHDPFLSDALHEVLSTVTAIRSTAGILNAGDPIDPEWQTRFHRNLYEDSQRLAEGSQALVTYLDTMGQSDDSGTAPLDEVEAFFAARAEAPEPAPEEGPPLRSPAARALADHWLARQAADAVAMPERDVATLIGHDGPDPARLAQAFGVDLATAMRRLAHLPEEVTGVPVGLVTCDASGALTYRKSLDGFSPPRFGAACPLWPLYQALMRPMLPLRRVIAFSGQPERLYLAHAISQPVSAPRGFDGAEVVEATMLFTPHSTREAADALPVGTACRVCARVGCAARREPSTLGGAEA